MKLKPKSTTRNPKALHYKRFISLEKSINLNIVYKTVSDNLFWTFDNITLTFTQVPSDLVPQGATQVSVNNAVTILQYQSTYFNYVATGWQKITNIGSAGITLLNASFNNIAKYQTNKYYYVNSFDFMIKGSIEGTTAQYIKGNIIPLTALNIKFFDDDIDLAPDDLVVIENKLFSVENPETVIKQQPKPFKIYFATLNNIL